MKLAPQKDRKNIISMPLDKFFNCLNCAKEYAIWLLFKINNHVGKNIEKKQISTKNKYIVFIGIMSKPISEKMNYLRLANWEKDNEDKEQDY